MTVTWVELISGSCMAQFQAVVVIVKVPVNGNVCVTCKGSWLLLDNVESLPSLPVML